MFGRRFWRRSMDSNDCKKQQSNGLNDDIDDEHFLNETHFVRALNCFFRVWGKVEYLKEFNGIFYIQILIGNCSSSLAIHFIQYTFDHLLHVADSIHSIKVGYKK